MIPGTGLVEWAVGIILSIAGAWAAWAAGRKSMREAEAVADPRTPYDALADRVMYLEERDREKDALLSRLTWRINELTSTLHGPVAHILDWIDQGAPPPPPAEQIRLAREAIRDLHNRRN